MEAEFGSGSENKTEPRAEAAVAAIVFDLDGVIVSTDHLHYRAWRAVAEAEGVPFDERRNAALRGVGREESLDLLLGERAADYSPERKRLLCERKNDDYRERLEGLTPADRLPGVDGWLARCRERGIRVAIGSSSKNTLRILERIGLGGAFDAVVTGHDVERSKPAPDIFLLAAERLGVPPERCWAVEDAPAGAEAARAAGMKVVAVGPLAAELPADLRRAEGLDPLLLERLLRAADAAPAPTTNRR